MALVLDGTRETHTGPEPRVKHKDVQAILRRFTGDDEGGRVALLAERSGYSTRTVYRVLQGSDRYTEDGVGLELADALVIAAGGHLALCHLVWPDGTETPYVS